MKVNWIFHDSHSEYFRKPFGAVPCGTNIRLRIITSKCSNIRNAILRLWDDSDGEKRINMNLLEQSNDEEVFEVEFDAPEFPCLIWYYFIIETSKDIFYFGNNIKNLGGVGEIYKEPPSSYQITVHRNVPTPDWFKDSIVYQIFVDRFNNGNENKKPLNLRKGAFFHHDWEDTPEYFRNDDNSRIVMYDFFGGNLLGIIKKLDYLKELGINAVYLNPVFDSSSNHKYDTGDYMNIDPMFGDNNLFKELCSTAEQLGIRVILDGVFSHTGSDSIYFNKEGNYNSLGAYQSLESTYYKWYRFKKHPDEYDCWWGIDTLPNVNEMEKSFLELIIDGSNSVLLNWMNMGASGWRLDVADELPDEFIKYFKKNMKEINKESVLIGEVWEDASNKISYGERRDYLLGEELDSVMNYPFRSILIDFLLGYIDAADVNLKLMHLYENYPKHIFYSTMNLVGSHDVPRIMTVLGDAPDEKKMAQQDKNKFRLTKEQKYTAVKRLKLISLIQMTFPGVPSIYYGDEVGLEGFSDPLNRKTYPWGKEDVEILNWYKDITGLRRTHDVLKTGAWTSVYAEGDIFVYLRIIKEGSNVFDKTCADNKALIAVNRSKYNKHDIVLDMEKWNINSMVDILDDNRIVLIKNGKLSIGLNPLQGKLYLERTYYE